VKMTVHFAYPSMAQVARSMTFRQGRGMGEIVPLEDDERGFNGPDGAQLVLNRRNAHWELCFEDGEERHGRGVLTLQKVLTRKYDYEK